MSLQLGIANRFQSNNSAVVVDVYRESRAVVNAEIVVVDVDLSVIAGLPSVVHTLVDQAFGGMATDADYQQEARDIAAEFADSDWEAFLKSEQDD